MVPPGNPCSTWPLMCAYPALFTHVFPHDREDSGLSSQDLYAKRSAVFYTPAKLRMLLYSGGSIIFSLATITRYRFPKGEDSSDTSCIERGRFGSYAPRSTQAFCVKTQS